MNLDEKLLGEIRAQFAKSALNVSFPREGTRQVKFLSGGKAEDNLLVSWSVTLDANRRPLLTLREGEGLFAVCVLHPDGRWLGRELRGQGRVVVSPEAGDAARWQTLSNPVQFYQEHQVDPDETLFRYCEPLPEEIDWSAYEYDVKEVVDFSVLPASDTAIALIACDRPTYFLRVLESLAANPEVASLPVFLFLDKSPRDGVGDDQVRMVRNLLPHCAVIRRECNWGCGRNTIDARRQLFDNAGYDRVFVFEDDLVVSPCYLGLCLRLFDWAQKHYSNVGAVQAWRRCDLQVEEKAVKLSEVCGTFENWWGYLMSRRCWDSFRERMYRYEELFLRGEYLKRPHRSILKWFALKREASTGEYGFLQCVEDDTFFPVNEEWLASRRAYFGESPTGQDAATSLLFDCDSWLRLTTTVNRALYIGKSGMHMNPGWYDRHGYGDVVLDEFATDAALFEFVPAV